MLDLDGLEVFTDHVARKNFRTMTERMFVPTVGASIINLYLSFDSVYALALCLIKGKGQDCMQLRGYDIE